MRLPLLIPHIKLECESGEYVTASEMVFCDFTQSNRRRHECQSTKVFSLQAGQVRAHSYGSRESDHGIFLEPGYSRVRAIHHTDGRVLALPSSELLGLRCKSKHSSRSRRRAATGWLTLDFGLHYDLEYIVDAYL